MYFALLYRANPWYIVFPTVSVWLSERMGKKGGKFMFSMWTSRVTVEEEKLALLNPFGVVFFMWLMYSFGVILVWIQKVTVISVMFWTGNQWKSDLFKWLLLTIAVWTWRNREERESQPGSDFQSGEVPFLRLSAWGDLWNSALFIWRCNNYPNNHKTIITSPVEWNPLHYDNNSGH